MQYLLDTDTCIYILKNSNTALVNKFEQHEGQVATSAIVLHELYYGAEGYAEPNRRMYLIEQLARRLAIVPFEQQAATAAGRLRHHLKTMGQTIGPFDALIGATALAHKLTLVTGNEREFSRIPKLKIENWIA